MKSYQVILRRLALPGLAFICSCGFGHAGLGTFDSSEKDQNSLLWLALLGGGSGNRVTQLAAFNHTCALFPTGNVRCWGSGANGRLGYGNTNNIGDNETPASAGDVNVGGTVTQITVGGSHMCALLSSGNVLCWGLNTNGQLGYGNTNTIGDDEVPASAGDVNVGGTVTQISAGNSHTCALLTNGAVRCWGSGANGRLGYANTNDIGDNETPASAGDVNVGGAVTQISVGYNHTCALLNTGNVRCWGFSGAMGYGNTNTIGDNETPASVGDLTIGGTVVRVAAGGDHSSVILSNGAIRSWGSNANGQLGYGNANRIGDDETPASAGDVNIGGTVTQISAGLNGHACVVLTDGALRCWGGTAGTGRLGYGNLSHVGDNETPASAGNVNVGGGVTQVANGFGHTCAILSSGNVLCWGTNFAGKLGLGNLNNMDVGDDELPVTSGFALIY
ncbi:MAG: hypothetical protein JNM27_08310 [Leptospirales bacterium]|nr:hypothetical protein [Leptospirales bacterium]